MGGFKVSDSRGFSRSSHYHSMPSGCYIPHAPSHKYLNALSLAAARHGHHNKDRFVDSTKAFFAVRVNRCARCAYLLLLRR